MRTMIRPIIKVRTYFDGKIPFTDAYADVFARIWKEQRKAKSSVRTFDSSIPLQYDLKRDKEECDSNGN